MPHDDHPDDSDDPDVNKPLRSGHRRTRPTSQRASMGLAPLSLRLPMRPAWSPGQAFYVEDTSEEPDGFEVEHDEDEPPPISGTVRTLVHGERARDNRELYWCSALRSFLPVEVHLRREERWHLQRYGSELGERHDPTNLFYTLGWRVERARELA